MRNHKVNDTVERIRIEKGWTKKEMSDFVTNLAQEIEAGKHDRMINYLSLQVESESKNIN